MDWLMVGCTSGETIIISIISQNKKQTKKKEIQYLDPEASNLPQPLMSYETVKEQSLK